MFLKSTRRSSRNNTKCRTCKLPLHKQQKQIEALTAGLQKVSAQLAAASPSLADLKRADPHRKRFSIVSRSVRASSRHEIGNRYAPCASATITIRLPLSIRLSFALHLPVYL